MQPLCYLSDVGKPRLVVADDHILVSEGISRLLETDFEIVARVDNGRALLEAAATVKCDAILLDISMPLLNGIEAARQIRHLHPEIKLVFVTMHSDPDYVSEAFRAGAAAYVLKRSAATELVQAVHEVLKGNTYVTPLVSRAAVQASDASSSGLTARQREVLQLVAEGYSAKQVASILNISVKTAEFHKAGIMDKLGLRTTAELTRYALQHHIT